MKILLCYFLLGIGLWCKVSWSCDLLSINSTFVLNYTDKKDTLGLELARKQLFITQSMGRKLYQECVAYGVIDEKVCAALLGAYRANLLILGGGKGMGVTKDLYWSNSFSPCGLHIANLILADICLKNKGEGG